MLSTGVRAKRAEFGITRWVLNETVSRMLRIIDTEPVEGWKNRAPRKRCGINTSSTTSWKRRYLVNLCLEGHVTFNRSAEGNEWRRVGESQNYDDRGMQPWKRLMKKSCSDERRTFDRQKVDDTYEIKSKSLRVERFRTNRKRKRSKQR